MGNLLMSKTVEVSKKAFFDKWLDECTWVHYESLIFKSPQGVSLGHIVGFYKQTQALVEFEVYATPYNTSRFGLASKHIRSFEDGKVVLVEWYRELFLRLGLEEFISKDIENASR